MPINYFLVLSAFLFCTGAYGVLARRNSVLVLMLVPLAVAGDPGALREGIEGVIIYIFIYAAMNLGAFACVIVNARRTHSAEISSFAGLGKTNPTLAVVFSLFLFSLAGIPPLAGWFAKFVMFRAVFAAGTTSAVILGVIAAVFSVVAFFYYVAVARQMWFREPADLGEVASTARTPVALNVALALTTIVVVVVGVYPQLFARIGDLAFSST